MEAREDVTDTTDLNRIVFKSVLTLTYLLGGCVIVANAGLVKLVQPLYMAKRTVQGSRSRSFFSFLLLITLPSPQFLSRLLCHASLSLSVTAAANLSRLHAEPPVRSITRQDNWEYWPQIRFSIHYYITSPQKVRNRQKAPSSVQWKTT